MEVFALEEPVVDPRLLQVLRHRRGLPLQPQVVLPEGLRARMRAALRTNLLRRSADRPRPCGQASPTHLETKPSEACPKLLPSFGL